MLTRLSKKALSIFLHVTCNVLRIFPYTWNPVTCRLRHATKVSLLIYNIHRWIHWIEAIFLISRLIASTTWDNVPVRIRIVSTTWTIAGSLSALCYIQLEMKRSEILFFANSLLAYMELAKFKEHKVSSYVVIGAILLATGVPVHAAMIFEQPCSPQFWSSLGLRCDVASDDRQTFVHELPYFFLECYAVTVNLSSLYFNWILIYLGLCWIKKELEAIRTPYVCNLDIHNQPMNAFCTRQKYRELQCVSRSLNSGFCIYLEWFPSILIGVVAMMLYGTTRFWYLRIHSYIMYPGCAAMCMTQAFTILGLAGDVNSESSTLLREWKLELGVQDGEVKKRHTWLSAFQRSCRPIQCSAGSLYAFEKSIVLCCTSHCLLLIMNLWLLT